MRSELKSWRAASKVAPNKFRRGVPAKWAALLRPVIAETGPGLLSIHPGPALQIRVRRYSADSRALLASGTRGAASGRFSDRPAVRRDGRT
jgi:hypothetical protein